MDFTSRKQMEQDLRETRDHLEETVGERTSGIDQTHSPTSRHGRRAGNIFLSIAHDMRAPLRSMRSFAEILLDEHADNLDSMGKGYLANTRVRRAWTSSFKTCWPTAGWRVLRSK